MTPHLIDIDWPDFGVPDLPPAVTLAEMRGRMAAIRAAMGARGLDRLVIYGDREHAANMTWASGFDPRFEEALLIIGREGEGEWPDGGSAGGSAVLAAGNECLSYTAISPLVVAGDIRTVLCPSLSLISQPRTGGMRLSDMLAGQISAGMRVGTVGWKYYGADEVADPAGAVELPAVLVDMLRALAGPGQVVNATDLFMHPGYGLRAVVSVDEIARMEFSNHMAAKAVQRMAFALREGMVDFAAVAAGQVGGLPLNCHLTFATGARDAMGLTGPSGQTIGLGRQISFNVAHWGSNICRAGWVARSEADLPQTAQGYLAGFAGPYVAGLSQWFSMMRPGVAGGAVWAQVQADLPFAIFGIFLNPGHLIGDDEWMSSPIYEGSDLPLRSGMAMQCDVIPAHPAWGSTRMEDGYIIADAALISALAAAHPGVLARMRARQGFMRDVIGLDVPDGLLPLADTCGIVAPFLLAPRRVIALR